jgi:mannan endo-1,4-beta-mannosidase
MKITLALLAAMSALCLFGRAVDAQITRIEAESGVLSGGAVVQNTIAGYSGAGYVGGFTTGQGLDTMTVTAPASGYYDLWVRYATPFGQKYAYVTVNGVASQLYLNTANTWATVNAGPVKLAAGVNTVSIGGDWGWYDIDYIEIDPVIHLEAEKGELSDGARVERTVSGFSGSGYVGGFGKNAGWVAFSDVEATAGSYELLIRYASPKGAKTCSAEVDGTQSSAALPEVGMFYTADGGTVSLADGANTIVIGGGSGGYDIDYVELRPLIALPISDAVVSGDTSLVTDSGAPGGEYAYVTDSGGVTWSRNVAPGMYSVAIQNLAPFGYKGVQVIADSLSTTTAFTDSYWNVVDAGQVWMDGNSDSVFVGDGWGWYYVGAVVLIPSAPLPPPLPVPATLSDPKANAQAYELLKYLNKNYGSGNMISGQHDVSEFPYVESNTGQQPAIAGVDFIDYSPSRTYFQGAPNPDPTDQILQQEAENGNIVTAMWHWNAPADLINSASIPWWSGFYTYATTFNVATALDNPNSNDYKLLLSNMDTIAAHLQELDQAGIPVLWRPFHEASGEWFWWGAQGPQPFIKLWKLMYDRFTGPTWNLHNLIWVFSGSDPSWYPGGSYVDIVGADAYDATVADMETDPTIGTWQEYKQAFDGKKLLALTEFGGVPDVELMDQFGVDWDYFMTWPGFEEQVPDSELSAFYNEPQMINESNLPAWDYVSPDVPTTTSSISGPQAANPNGWYDGPVGVSLSATDSNPIAATYYTLDGSLQRTYGDPIPVSGDGRHTVVFWSVDTVGNVEPQKTCTVLIDSVAPTTVFGKPVPAPNAAGWNNTPVTMAYASTDATSGIIVTAPTGRLSFESEGAGQTQTVTQTDVAGNVGSATSPAVNIDMTPPVTTAEVTGAKVKLIGTDNLSGIAHTFYTIDGGSTTLYKAAFKVLGSGSHTVSYWSTDKAGNSEAHQVVTVTVS